MTHYLRKLLSSVEINYQQIVDTVPEITGFLESNFTLALQGDHSALRLLYVETIWIIVNFFTLSEEYCSYLLFGTSSLLSDMQDTPQPTIVWHALQRALSL